MPNQYGRTPSGSATTVGSAVPLPAQYAALNTSENPTAGIEQYVDDHYQQTGVLPPGFKVENGHAVPETPGFLMSNPWIFPVLGATLGLAGLAAGPSTAAALGPSTAANVGATTAATSVPASLATTGAGVASKSLVSSLIPTIASVGGNLLGSWMQSNASTDAAKIQDAYLREALGYEKERDAYDRARTESQYADLTRRLDPYIKSGASSTDRMTQLLGLPSRAGSTTGMVTPARTLTTASPEQPQKMTPSVEPTRQAMITVQAPNGQTQQRPASERQHWIDRGATVLEGAAA